VPSSLEGDLVDLGGLVEDEDEVHSGCGEAAAPVATYYLEKAPRC
jgi:hypothetical protein